MSDLTDEELLVIHYVTALKEARAIVGALSSFLDTALQMDVTDIRACIKEAEKV